MKRYKEKASMLFLIIPLLCSCNETTDIPNLYTERQITFTLKNHALDNNDNFSVDDKFLCYDTRSTVYNGNLANSKSIEKVEIATGTETVLWNPPFITGEDAAPGVAAVSFHPKENKVIFIHGPFLEEVKERGYYNTKNRTAVLVDGNGSGLIAKPDMRDISNNPTTPGAHRGGSHRHEYTRSGNRIGFTYDDFLVQQFERTIAFLESSDEAPKGYSHYFNKDAFAVRWYPNDKSVYCHIDGNIASIGIEDGKTNMLTNDSKKREHLVVSHDGKSLAYIISTPTIDELGKTVKDVSGNDFRQIFIMNISS